jgi:flavin-dependent dehydrogenase
MTESPSLEYDVVIIGGAFSGAAAALLLKRRRPETRILIVERRAEPDRKVGESTSEVAGCFLTRELGLYRHMSQHHLVKHGLRMWFTTPENNCVGQCGEIGPYFQSRLPTFQIDRSTLDPHVLSLAVEAGCELWKPATVAKLELNGVGENYFEIKKADGQLVQVKAKWVLDSSGRVAYIARQRGTLTALPEHPTNSIWARFSNVGDLDGAELAQRYPEFAQAARGPRGVATNHLMGYGWWCWIIPLKNGDVSVGVTYDTRRYTPPAGATLTERLHNHLMQHPVGREMFEHAVPCEKDTRTYSNLPYYSKEVAGAGWVACGDAAGFMDPLYSQGLDYCGHTVMVSTDIIERGLNGEDTAFKVARYNEEFQSSYSRWFHALYKDKYAYLGDMDLMWPAFLLDIGTYFLGPVRFVYDQPKIEWYNLPYHGGAGKFFANFMALYNRRLVAIAEKRQAAGVYGMNNLKRRKLVGQGFSPDFNVFKLIRQGVAAWLKLEWHALWLPKPEPKSAPSQETVAAV